MKFYILIFMLLLLQSCMSVSHTIGYNYEIPLQFDYPIYKKAEGFYYSNIKNPSIRYNAAKCTVKSMKYNKKIPVCDSVYEIFKKKCFSKGLEDEYRVAYCVYTFNFSKNIYNSDNSALRASKIIKDLFYIDIFDLHKKSKVSGKHWVQIKVNNKIKANK